MFCVERVLIDIQDRSWTRQSSGACSKLPKSGDSGYLENQPSTRNILQ